MQPTLQIHTVSNLTLFTEFISLSRDYSVFVIKFNFNTLTTSINMNMGQIA